jgi:hypothetical protein
MPNWIEHIWEPTRLYLAWQAPEHLKERKRFAVGELVRAGNDCNLRYFENDEVREAQNLGFLGYPAFKLGRKEYQNVLATFLRRLPPRGRSDFDSYMAHFRLPPAVKLSDFALLAYTEAKLPSDGFSLVNSLDEMRRPCEFVLEVAGYRHYANKTKPLAVSEAVELVAEPENPFDQNAIAVKASGDTIGYINRLQTHAFHNWIRDQAVVAIIERLNGTAPKPRAFIFVWVKQAQSRAA